MSFCFAEQAIPRLLKHLSKCLKVCSEGAPMLAVLTCSGLPPSQSGACLHPQTFSVVWCPSPANASRANVPAAFPLVRRSSRWQHQWGAQLEEQRPRRRADGAWQQGTAWAHPRGRWYALWLDSKVSLSVLAVRRAESLGPVRCAGFPAMNPAAMQAFLQQPGQIPGMQGHAILAQRLAVLPAG